VERTLWHCGGGNDGLRSDDSEKPFQVKPDLKHFLSLTDEDKFPEWLDHTIHACSATTIADCVEWNYVPPPGERKSFNAKNKWFYFVLHNKVKTSTGRDILRQHREDMDGRMVLWRLVQSQRESANADVRAEALMEKITSIRCDSSWNKSILDFIITLDTLFGDYNDLVRHSDQLLNEGMRRVQMERAVRGIPALREVKQREQHRITELGLTKDARSEHRRYCQLREFPIQPIRPLNRVDQMFDSLCAYCEQSEPQVCST